MSKLRGLTECRELQPLARGYADMPSANFCRKVGSGYRRKLAAGQRLRRRKSGSACVDTLDKVVIISRRGKLQQTLSELSHL